MMPPARQVCGARRLRVALVHLRDGETDARRVSAPTGGNRYAPPLPASRPRVARSPGSAAAHDPARWSWRACRCPSRRPESTGPSAAAFSTASASNVAVARICPGVRTSTTTSETGPSVCVCRMKRPTSFSEVASSEASTAASATRRFTGPGKVVALQDRVDRGAERHHASAHVQALHLERQSAVVAAGRIEDRGGCLVQAIRSLRDTMRGCPSGHADGSPPRRRRPIAARPSPRR